MSPRIERPLAAPAPSSPLGSRLTAAQTDAAQPLSRRGQLGAAARRDEVGAASSRSIPTPKGNIWVFHRGDPPLLKFDADRQAG